MKKILLLLISVTFFSCSKDESETKKVESVEKPIPEKVFDGYVRLTSQAEVDAFVEKRYTKINGGLLIGFDNTTSSSNITDISGLKMLSSAQYLYIGNNTLLTNLDALFNIKELTDGYLVIKNNAKLENIKGLKNLTQIKGRIEIGDNPALVSLEGLEGIRELSDALIIYGNNIETLKGLGNLEKIGKNLEITYSQKLKNLNGLEKLASIGDSFYLWHNDVITNIDALKALKSIGGSTLFRLNKSLVNLDGFINLTSIGKEFSITNNSDGALISISGLKNLKSNGLVIQIIGTELKDFTGLNAMTSAYSLNIQNNSKLKDLTGLDNITAVTAALNIHNCNFETLKGLNNIKSIGGNLYIGNSANLVTIDALQNVASVGGYIKVEGNKSLTSFCGLKVLLEKGLNTDFRVENNLYNPTIQDITGNNCSK